MGGVMNNLLVWLASLPDLALYGLIGAISTVLTALLFRLKDFQWVLHRWQQGPFRRLPIWVPVISIVLVISLELSQVLVPQLKAQTAVDRTIQIVEKIPLYKTIFQYHPDAKEEMRAALQKIYAGPADQIRMQRQQLSETIVSRYYYLHLPTASDSSIHHILETNSRIMEMLKEKPKICVSFYLETSFNASDIPASLIEEGANMKVDVIESSAKNPFHRENLKPEQAGAAIIDAYRKNGFQFSEIEKIGNINSLPADEGCTIARHFSSTIVSMDEKAAAAVFTSLMAVAK
jgi:hypothetical protein